MTPIESVIVIVMCNGGTARWANLRGADLSGANLRGADLCGADLSGADLGCADLRETVGFVLLPVADYRGYSFPHAVLCGDQWRVRSGCRDFSISEARRHWGEEYAGQRDIGDMYLYAIDWLERKIGA